ncbi:MULTISPECIES: stalk domain-containing protein [Paenibacillus]|uniref:Copper amine oxidase-like N-terminal domain-containing protein n=1 Tax=Paenibacillus peoriae TaxID=59893 RepID=A0ABU1QHR0_9BACL|nr:MULTISPECIES: stalk domain-containing protein [Paenibacillus]MDR6779132.1 hypothetical protein [Paenibacillus peoriae]
MNTFSKAALATTISFSMLASGVSGASGAASKSIIMQVNNVPLPGDVDLYVQNGSTLVALNMIRSIPGVTINWNNTSKTVTVDNNGTKSTLVAGKKETMVGDKKVTLPTSSVMKMVVLWYRCVSLQMRPVLKCTGMLQIVQFT